MAKRSSKRSARVRKSNARAARETRVLGSGGVELVRTAAGLLDSELKVGVDAAKAVQRRLATDRRIDAADFRDALQRFQANARELVNALDQQLVGAKLPQNVDLAKRFLAKTGDLIDLTAGVVVTGAEITNEFVQTNRIRKGERKNARPRPRPRR